jgi:hypothetical protein
MKWRDWAVKEFGELGFNLMSIFTMCTRRRLSSGMEEWKCGCQAKPSPNTTSKRRVFARWLNKTLSRPYVGAATKPLRVSRNPNELARRVTFKENTMNTCDDLICSGNSKLSGAIKKMNRLTGKRGIEAELTHQATFVMDDEVPLVFESTTMNKWADKRGVQLNPYDKWLANYNGRVWGITYDFDRTQEFTDSVWTSIDKYIGTDYESGIAGGFELLLAGLKLDRIVRMFNPSYHPTDVDNLHCTEVGVLLKKDVGLIRSEAVANRMPPCEWWDGGFVHKFMKHPIKDIIRLK